MNPCRGHCRPLFFVPVRTILAGALALSISLAAVPASAGVWQWGCVGALGNDQVAFNRDRLIIIGGKGKGLKLHDVARHDDFADGVAPDTIVAAYRADDINGGLSSPMTFTSESGGGTLTLSEEASEETGHSEGLVAGCRDETTDRFRKTYRMERDGMAPATVILKCMEYQLSSRGGRMCE